MEAQRHVLEPVRSKPESQITDEVRELDKEVSGLRDIIEALGERLTPILLPSDDKSGGHGRASEITGLSPLASEIERIRGSAAITRSMLEELMSRLAL